MTPLFSIIIATRNRQYFCYKAIINILRYPDQDFELVVMDNSGTDDLKLKTEVLQDPRIVYRHDRQPLSFIANFEAAVSLARGKYLCVIGDDDTVLPDIFGAVRWADRHDLDSLTPTPFVHYLWPGVNTRFMSGLVTLKKYSARIRAIDPKKNLERFISRGGIEYLDYELPKLYHGIVRKSCLDEVKAVTGHYFGGLTPDIYAVAALSLTGRRHMVADYPLTIAGVCKTSGSAASDSGEHRGKLETAPHLANRGPYEWHPLVPRFYSVETIWLETAIKAIEEMNQPSLLKNFNLARFNAYALVKNHEILEIASRAIQQHPPTVNLENPALMNSFLRFSLSAKVNLVSNLRRIKSAVLHENLFKFRDVNDIDEAATLTARACSGFKTNPFLGM